MAFMNLFNKKKEGGEKSGSSSSESTGMPPAPPGLSGQAQPGQSQPMDDFPPPPPSFDSPANMQDRPGVQPEAQFTGNDELPKVGGDTPPPADPNVPDDIPPPPSFDSLSDPSQDDMGVPPPPGAQEGSSGSIQARQPNTASSQPPAQPNQNSGNEDFLGFNKPEFEPPPPIEEPGSGKPDDDIPDDLFSEILGGSQPSDEETSQEPDWSRPPSDSQDDQFEQAESFDTPASQEESKTELEDDAQSDDSMRGEFMQQQESGTPEDSESEISMDFSQIDTSQPLFISAKDYHDMIKDVNSLTSQIKKFEDIFAKIYDFKIQQNDDFENWRKILEFLHKKLSTVDETLYAPKGEKQ